MKKRIVGFVILLLLSCFSITCQATTYSNLDYHFSFTYPVNYLEVYNPRVAFQAQDGNKDFHIIINDTAVSQLYNANERVVLQKLLNKFYDDAARNAYAPIEFKIFNHSFKWTNSGEHQISIIDYGMFMPSGEARYCMLGTVISKGVIYSIYYLAPNPTTEEIAEAEYCLRSFFDI